MIGVVAGMPVSGKVQRFSVWNRRDEVSGNMNKRRFWAWHGSIWHAPVAALVMPLSKDRLFPQEVLPARGDKSAQIPPTAMLSITEKDATIIKSLCRMQCLQELIFASLTIGILEVWNVGIMDLMVFYRF